MDLIAVYALVIVALIWTSLQFLESIKYHTWKRAFRDAILDWELDSGQGYQPFPYKISALEKHLEDALMKNRRSGDLILALKDFIIAVDDGEPEKIGSAYSGAVEVLNNFN